MSDKESRSNKKRRISPNKSQLTELRIQSLGVIDNAVVEFQPGLNVLTGETGAGKTMVLTALNLVIGGKSDTDLIRRDSERLTASARFSINNASQCIALLEENGVELEDGELLITRTVNRDGKSRGLLGGVSATASTLSTVSEELLEIHGQSANARLNKPWRQRELLDDFAGDLLHAVLTDYQKLYEEVKTRSAEILALQKSLREREKEIAELEELHTAFTALKPQPDEIFTIDAAIARLDSVEELRLAVSEFINLSERDDFNPFTEFNSARKALEAVHGKDEKLDRFSSDFADLLITLQELNREFVRYRSDLNADPARLQHLQERKSSLNQLLKKFGKGSDRRLSYEQLIDDGEKAARRIKDLQGGDERIQELEKERLRVFHSLREKAEQLSQERKKAADILSSVVTREIHDLAMPHASFQISITQEASEKFSDFSEHGIDTVEMMFCSHKNGELLPITKAASGGELSRLMLGLEVALAHSAPVGTYIFDEIDAGVGGKAAIEVGRKLAQLAQSTQVIVVTHLAQVAAWADCHFQVEKNDSGAVTESTVRRLDRAAREIEIARMLSGREDSEIAQQHAKELIDLIRS